MTNFSLKQLTLTLVILLFTLGGVIAGGIYYLSEQNAQVKRDWQAFQAG